MLDVHIVVSVLALALVVHEVYIALSVRDLALEEGPKLDLVVHEVYIALSVRDLALEEGPKLDLVVHEVYIALSE